MAGLPENSQYQTGGIPSSVGPISKSLGINFSQPGLIKQSTQALQDQMSGVEPGVAGGILPKTGNGILDFITSGRSFASGAPMSGATMDQGYDLFSQGAYNVEGPLATYDGSRMPIPEDYQWRDQAPSDQAYILNFQNGGGQMVVDPNNRGAIFKSARDEMGGSTAGSIDRQMSLGSRSSGLFQIDHIIPLWLGGADTDYNKETISTAKHARKTKVQAVPYTLLRKGLITADEARTWAMNWQDLDYKDIPAPSEESGMMGEVPVQFAKDKLAVWKKHKAEGFYPNNKTPGLFATMHDPEFAKTLGEDIIPGDGVVADTLQEIYKGAASGATFGWVPYVPDDDVNGAQKLLGLVANIGTSMIVTLALGGLGAGAQVATRGASVLNKMKLAGWLGKGAQTAAQAASVAQKAGTVAETAKTATTGLGNLLNVTRPFYNSAANKVSKAKDFALKFSFMKNDPAALNMMKKVGIGSIAYGQLGPQGIAGAMAGEEGAEPFERFAEDFIYSGVALFAKPGMRGLVPTMATPIALGMAIDGMSGEELNTKEWITTSLLMGGLHLYGSPAMKARAAFVTKELEKGLTVNAHTKVSSFVSEESLPKLVEGKPVPKPEGVDENGFLSIAEAEQKEAQLWNEARESVIKMRNEGGIDEASMMMELTDIKRSLHQLKKSWLSDTDRRALDIEDIEFTLDSIKNGRSILPEQMGKSTAVSRLKNVITREDLGSLKAQDPLFPELKKGEVPTYSRSETGNIIGKLPLTGPGVEADDGLLGQLGKNASEYIVAVKEGRASPTLIGVERSDLAPTIKEINATYTTKQIEAGMARPSQNPQNVIEVYGAFFDPKGNIHFKIVGYVPRKFAISEKARAINRNEKRPEKADPELNKDTFADELRAKGFKFFTMNFDEAASGVKAVYSGKPYLNVTLNDANWSLTQRINEKYLSRVRDEEGSAASMAELIMEAKNATGKARQTFIDKINKVLRDDNLAADDVLRKASEGTASSKSSEAMTAYLYDVRRALETGTDPASVAANFKETLTIDLTPEEARALFLQKNELSVAQVLKITDTAIKEGRMGDKALIYEGFVKPFMASSDFVRWGMRRVFDDLKIIGDPSVARNMSKTGGVEKIPGEFDAIDTTAPKAPIQETAPVAAPVSPAQPAPMSKNVLDLTGASSLVSIPQKKSSKLAAALTNHAAKSPMIQRKPEVPVEGDVTISPINDGATPPKEPLTDAKRAEVASLVKKSEPTIEGMVEANRRAGGRPSDVTPPTTVKVSQDSALSRSAEVGKFQETQKKLIRQALEEIEFTQRSGEKSYMTRLKATAERNIPGMEKLPREFSYAEKKEIVDHLRDNARLLAYETFITKIPAEPRVSFSEKYDGKRIKTLPRNNAKGGELPKHDAESVKYEETILLKEAMDRDFFKVPGGFDENGQKITSVEAVKQAIGDESFERAWTTLNTVKADDGSISVNEYTPAKIGQGAGKKFSNKFDKKSPPTEGEVIAAGKTIKDFIDDKLLEKDGTYFKSFADTVDQVMTQSLGKEWRTDPDVIKIFGATVDPRTGGYPKDSLFGKIFEPRSGKTQPDDVIRFRGEGRHRQSKAAEAARKDANIDQQIEAANRRASERGPMDEGNTRDDMGDYSPDGENNLRVADDAMSADDLDRLSLISENQSDANNFPEESAFDMVFAGVTDYLRRTSRGEKAFLSPANGITDATEFLYKVNNVLRGINPKKRLLVEHADIRQSVSSVLKKLTGKHKITDKSVVDLYQEGQNLTDLIDHNQSEAADIMENQIIPMYANLQREAGYRPPSKTDPADAIREVERYYTKRIRPLINKLGDKAVTKPLTEKEIAFSNIYDKYKDVLAAIHEDTLRREVLRADAVGKKKNLSAGEISKLIEKRPKPPEFY